MGSGVSIPTNLLSYPLDASDITTPSQAVSEVKRLRAILLANNDARITHLLLLNNEEELQHHHDTVLTAMTRRENERKKEKLEAEKRGDYSNCFSGTAEDTKNEAEAAALLKGGVEEDNEDTAGEYVILKPLSYNNVSDNALAVLESKGKWMKYLNMNDCYGYVHGLTLEVRGNRPETYEDQEEATQMEQAKLAQQKKDELRTIEPRDVKEMIDEVEEIKGKTLLLLTDGEHDETLRTYFTMHGVICDLAELGLSVGEQRKQGIRVKNVLNQCRLSCIAALKNGKTMGIFIGDIDGNDLPIVDKLCVKPLGGPSIFPAQLFQNKGKGLFDKLGGTKLKLNRLFKKEDGGPMFKLKFQTVVISSAGKSTYKRQLKACFPLEEFVVVLVK